MAIKTIPAWNRERILHEIADILATPYMTGIKLTLDADLDTVPTLTYTVTKHAGFPEWKFKEYAIKPQNFEQ